ncbi:MAG: L,D-transpeptidase [Salinibacterium sp.]|nr:L,D-transpeptidase [Salinibacterium sp.]MBF0673151.1 L,D-transpeptidase [Salinibacterium sp.]
MDRRRGAQVAGAGIAIAAAGLCAVLLWPRDDAAPAERASTSTESTAMPSPSPSPSPSPGPSPVEQYPVDPSTYDLAALPATQVYSVIPQLPLDPEPHAPVLPLTASALAPSIPVFPEPGASPVAQLPHAQAHDGTAVPVIEQHPHWVRVLLPARAGLPSGGVVGQTTGWVRAADVTLNENPYLVRVSLSEGTISVTESGRSVYESSGFGFGTPATPTPLGRTFVMTVFTDPAATYTRGNPTTALAVQSPTLDGFGGASVAVTAFHYHDARSGPISNGCIRVDAATAQYLAGLPLGTPVLVAP